MRFTRFPRKNHMPIAPSKRRVAAANGPYKPRKTVSRSFLSWSPIHTAEERLEAIDRDRAEWWQKQRDFTAAQWRKARALLRQLPLGPRTGIIRYWQKGVLPGNPTYLLGLIHDHRAKKRCFWNALAELRRFELISAGRLPNPWKEKNRETE